jgi:hypothetical protein
MHQQVPLLGLQMLIDIPNPIQNQRPFLSTRRMEQPVVNNFKHNYGNTQLGPEKT